MTSPTDVAAFHREFDRHRDDRIRLFEPLGQLLAPSSHVLYPGSYVDIAPSVWFDHVTYVDVDTRAARFFAQIHDVGELVGAKRRVHNPVGNLGPAVRFHHLDYRDDLPIAEESVDLLVSLYAGFISEHCTRFLRIGGTLLVNPSHGDVAMASLDGRYQLAGAVHSANGRYRIDSEDLGAYLVPKKRQQLTVASLHEAGRGIAYTRSAFAYLFTRVG